ncbi:hypothetical protein ACWEF6_02825 [Amycolatopsis sp. NPDC004772]
MADRTRASYLSPPDFARLDWACRPVAAAFDRPVYLVGSVLQRPNYRDVDLRLIADDTEIERWFGTEGRYGTPERPTPQGLWRLLNVALSDFIARAASLPVPVDFQIQARTEANATAGGRNPIGIEGVGRD